MCRSAAEVGDPSQGGPACLPLLVCRTYRPVVLLVACCCMTPTTSALPHPSPRHPAAAAAKSLLLAVMPGVLEPQRPLATVRLPGRGQPTICAVRQEEAPGAGGAGGEEGSTTGAEWETRLAVATGEGILYSYRLELPTDSSDGGGGGGIKCSLEGEWSLLASRS